MPARALCERVVRVLGEHTPRIEVLDRDLRIDAERCADFIGLDGDGRWVVGVVAEIGDEELFLSAVAALAFVRANRAAIARHLELPVVGVRAMHEELDARVVVVASAFDGAALQRFDALDPAAVTCFEMRGIETRRGRSDVLAPVNASQPASSRGAVGAAPSLAERVVRRLARIDGELVRTTDGAVVHWRWRGQTLCSVTDEGASLEASLTGVQRPFALHDERDCGPFLDAVTRRYLALLPQPARRDEGVLTPLSELDVTAVGAR